MRRLRFLASRHRSPSTNRMLGLLLAFNAGAINAGGYLALHVYTSHMSGFASQMADSLVLGNVNLLLGALGAILSFTCGAALSAVLVNWARQHRLRQVYAFPLVLEALLMAPFGLMGAASLSLWTPFAVPLTVLLLSFMMGLQNAVTSKASGGSVRTTHMTGHFTDAGMAIGKLLYLRAAGNGGPVAIERSLHSLRMAGGLIAMFVLGGVAGAFGFKHAGFVCVLPLAAMLLALSTPPLLRDVVLMRRRRRSN